MATPQFNRGLSKEFVGALNDEYGNDGWWRNLVDDQETFLAIRGEYINVYYRGCSLLLLELKENRIVGSVDYKYLLRPDLHDGNRSIKILDGKPQIGEDCSHFFLGDLGDVNDLKRAVEPYAGEEKIGVHKIILNNPNVVDTEIAISDNGRAPRIDLAALHKVDGRIEVMFYEAKHFNNPDLRANEAGTPKVLKQISTYSRLLEEQCNDLRNSYTDVCRNLSELCGVAKRHPERHKLLGDIEMGTSHLFVDTEPWLLVFGYDADQKDGLNWKKYRDRLRKELGGRVKMVGRSEELELPR